MFLIIEFMSENGVPDELMSAPENLPPERLRRSTINRKLAGVAGGIGERFDVDANVVRVVFVVLTLLAGLGAAVYLALWALVPLGEDSDEKRVARTSGDNEPRWSFRSLILLAGALCLGLIFLSVIFRGPGSGRGISAFWLLFFVVLAVVSLLRPGHFRFLRFFLGLLIALVSVAVLAAGGVLAYVASTGVPLSGGVGQRIYQPYSASQVRHHYHLGIGDMTIDLRGVGFSHNSLAVTATVAIGRLTVEVPPGVQVNLSAQSGSSSIVYPFGRQAFYYSDGAKGATSHLDLTVQVGIGSVSLYRSGPGVPVLGQ